MNVEFQGRGLPVPAALADHARRRLHFVLMHRSAFVQRVVVRLGGTNSRRGRNDMYCLMQVYLSDAQALAVVDIGADIHAVIDRATDRLCRMVVAHLEQTRSDRPQVAAIGQTAPRRELHAANRAGRSVAAWAGVSR